MIQKFCKLHSVHTVALLPHSHHRKIFRQINSLVKPLLSRNFRQKCERENSRIFHTVHSVEFTKFLYHSFLKNFRENNLFSKGFYFKIDFTKYFSSDQKFRKRHTVQSRHFNATIAFCGKNSVKSTFSLQYYNLI